MKEEMKNKRVQKDLEWKKKAEEILDKHLGPAKAGEKQGGEQKDSDESDTRKRRIDDILQGITLGLEKEGEGQEEELNDTDEPGVEKRGIDDILKGIEKREKEALAKEDGNEDPGDPMQWDPDFFERERGYVCFQHLAIEGRGTRK
jgi:hypothetical protein